eukprot:GEMP01048667.1.p1 GENE.GEMP01048667.1~~GEMP01048667.1.p1  ORF type:complete len:223 (+),score=-3.68 GEMP01048667.1:348-1016(+)
MPNFFFQRPVFFNIKYKFYPLTFFQKAPFFVLFFFWINCIAFIWPGPFFFGRESPLCVYSLSHVFLMTSATVLSCRFIFSFLTSTWITKNGEMHLNLVSFPSSHARYIFVNWVFFLFRYRIIPQGAFGAQERRSRVRTPYIPHKTVAAQSLTGSQKKYRGLHSAFYFRATVLFVFALTWWLSQQYSSFCLYSCNQPFFAAEEYGYHTTSVVNATKAMIDYTA